MSFERRVPLPWLLLGAVVVCMWCSLLSGIGGWVMGRDLARREAQARLATAEALPPLGVLVIRLDRTGPAANAGVQRGDLVVAIDGTPVEAARDLHDQLRSYRAGDMVWLTVLREDSEEQIAVETEPFPGDERRPYLGIYYTARGDEPADL